MEENKKKVSSREAWRLHRRAAKLFYAERPALHAVNWLYAAFKSLSPYVLIWLSAQIIGELTGARDAHRLTVLAVAAVAAIRPTIQRASWNPSPPPVSPGPPAVSRTAT